MEGGHASLVNGFGRVEATKTDYESTEIGSGGAEAASTPCEFIIRALAVIVEGFDAVLGALREGLAPFICLVVR